MTSLAQPAKANGKICYIEIPAADIQVSVDFYKKTFGWNIREHGNGSMSFDDTVGQVSGIWVKDRTPNDGNSIVIHIMVNDIRDSLEKVVANGGKVKQAPANNGAEKVALILDPAGNVFGIYEDS